jgi:hypothetical protein
MNNIAHQPETKIAFQQCQASKILKKLSCNNINPNDHNTTNSNNNTEHLKVLVYLILAQIVDENEFDKSNDPSSELIESISNYIKESLKKEHRYKGISTGEYMDCMARLAITKENKIRIYECGMLNVFKIILSNAVHGNNYGNSSSGSMDQLGSALTCIWNLCFDDKVCEIFRKDKELVGLLSGVKNNLVPPNEEMQKKAAGILFTLGEFHKISNLIILSRFFFEGFFLYHLILIYLSCIEQDQFS